MADLARDSEIAAGIVLHGDGEVNTIFKIAFDRFDNRDFSIEGNIKDVGLFVRTQADPVAFANSSLLAFRRPRMAPCSFASLFGRQSLRAFQDLAAAVAGFAHLALFFIAERQHAKGEHLVDLGAVEEIALAFRRDLRVVVKDDRR